jgi:uncharacterized phage protein gp47/JayE
MLSALLASVPDAYTGTDGILRILLDIESAQLENVFLANQLLLEDLFVQTASLTALKLYGAQYGVAMKDGIRSSGSLLFTGAPGTYIPFNTEVAYDPGTGVDPVYFLTTIDGTIPSPGNPTAPTATLNATAGNLTGTFVYKVTFVTATGETTGSPDSNAVAATAQQMNLTNIPLGGTGTVSRRIYRQKNGVGNYQLVTTIANNTATTYTDNIADGSLGAVIPTADTSNTLSLAAQAEETGANGNALAATITALSNAPSALTDVTNPAPFTGGTDPEDTEDFRTRLLSYLQAPQTGSPGDLKNWAEAVDGVESATVFSNDNLGTPQNGHVTVRISAPGGTQPSAGLLQAVADALSLYDLATVTLHVSNFTAVSTNVSVTLTLASSYTHTDVDPTVNQAIQDYINSLPVGGTVYINGIIDAVFGLPGVTNVAVTVPATDQATAATSKRVPGTITIA